MQLKDYIQGNRQGKEANRLEREAMDDPFLQGALDGFDSVAGDHTRIIEQLEEKYTHPAFGTRHKKRVFFYWAAAASVLLLIGISAYFFFENSRQILCDFPEIQLAEKGNVISSDSSVESKSQSAEPLLAEATIKETAPAPANPVIPPVTSGSVISASSANDVADIDTRSVSISDAPEEAPLVAETTDTKQNIQIIHGKIVDENGEPLAGASITEKGSTNGTVTDTDGIFTLQLPAGDSSELIASYLGYQRQEINPSAAGKTVVLKQDNNALSEVVVVGYGVQKKSSETGAVSRVLEGKTAGVNVGKDGSTPTAFGEKDFQVWCQQKADKNVCEGKEASVKVSFFIDETGKPSNIEYKKYSCEEAREEVKNLLSSSPAWTKTNRKVTITIKW